MGKTGRAQFTDVDVLTAARERISIAFDRFDHIVVSFSGGKDSTACLNLVLDEARRRGRLPLDVMFFDEEAIPDLTVDYCRRVANSPDIRFHWFCLPVMHRNACSRKEPWWYCWDPEKRDLWCRELPPEGITEHPRFRKGMTVPDMAQVAFGRERGTLGVVLGIRAQESLRRRRIVSMKEHQNWITELEQGFRAKVYPIYDWLADDVWVAPGKLNWDYNSTYDVYDKMGIPLSGQRVCPPYGEEPLQGLHRFHVCFPELWAKMINRVHGCATAARYARTELYANALKAPPEGMTWESYLLMTLDMYDDREKAEITDAINRLIRLHNTKSPRKIQEDTPDPISGISWRFLCGIALRGDFKGRRAGKMIEEARRYNEKNGMTLEEVLASEGYTRY